MDSPIDHWADNSRRVALVLARGWLLGAAKFFADGGIYAQGA